MTQTGDSATPHHRRVSNLPAVVLYATIAFAVIAFFTAMPMVFSGADRDVIIRIPKSATSQMVADSLTKYLGQSYSDRVMRLMRIRHVDYDKRHGAYLIPKGMSPFMAQRRLRRGAQNPVTLTFNGFLSREVLAERISRKLDFPADSLLALLSDPAVLAPYGLTPEQSLSLFLEDSYEVYWTSSPRDVIRKIGDNYLRVWNPDRRQLADNMCLTPAEVMTLCSIVDQETNKEKEKGRIGRLYVNRLWAGMKLQADPTVRFALNDYSIRRINAEHLKVDSPYNTYLHEGLPPGPIRTTSVATIDRVLNSEQTDEFYMCAREDFSGYHNFAATYKEHLDNAMRYQHALNRRGIK